MVEGTNKGSSHYKRFHCITMYGQRSMQGSCDYTSSHIQEWPAAFTIPHHPVQHSLYCCGTSVVLRIRGTQLLYLHYTVWTVHAHLHGQTHTYEQLHTHAYTHIHTVHTDDQFNIHYLNSKYNYFEDFLSTNNELF